jgi:hypothetical protein
MLLLFYRKLICNNVTTCKNANKTSYEQEKKFVISGFYREVDENCVLLGYYAASSANNNNIYYLQVGFHPVALNKLHVYNL